MDIYCPHCAEPLEIDYLHDVADEMNRPFAYVRTMFQKYGCKALPNLTCTPRAAGRTVSALWDLAGDDLDGLAVDLADADALGLLG